MQYDGFLWVQDNLNSELFKIGLSQDGGTTWTLTDQSANYNQFSLLLAIRKGDMIYVTQPGRRAYVAYYKKRDYSNR